MRYFLIVYLFFELLFSYSIATKIGFWGTFFEIILSAMLGFYILLNFSSTMRENLTALRGIKNAQTSSMFSFLGAILLIIPGFLTDIVGLALQFGTISNIIINRTNPKQYNHTKESNDEIIDVEIISSTSYTK
ncbi:MAG: FxsA family protein [Sulfurimonas sp.]|jgi:UPF0716 family protein affecting phage T7 exclusion|nr:FxsA family protein [Sulfurimonadaceae bacterium]